MSDNTIQPLAGLCPEGDSLCEKLVIGQAALVATTLIGGTVAVMTAAFFITKNVFAQHSETKAKLYSNPYTVLAYAVPAVLAVGAVVLAIITALAGSPLYVPPATAGLAFMGMMA